MSEKDHLINERLRKLKEIQELGVNPYPYKYNQTHHSDEIQKKYKKLKTEQKTKDSVSVAGRIMILRRMGKATFVDIQDEKGKIQAYFNQDQLGKPKYKFLKKLDIGDFIGVKGTIFKTRMGEVTIQTKNYELLSKSIRPLPEKYHGLQDVEARYRQRYLDLIFNKKSMETFRIRSQVIKGIREFLDKKNFYEADTPILQPIYGGANARPFTTHHNTLNMQLYLRISDELYLKRLVIGGFERVYEIGKDFRNEGMDTQHNPEFTMIEWYWAYADYNDNMKLIEQMIGKLAKDVTGSKEVVYQGKKINFKAPWKRLSMKESLKKFAKINVDKMTEKEMKAKLKGIKIELRGKVTKGVLINALFEEFAQDKIVQPTFITDYPKEVSPLTKVHRKDDTLTERFELFINGEEYANAYSELNNPVDQRERLKAQVENRELGDDEAQPMDEEFLTSMEYGMPPMSGLGLGIDRLVMLLTNSPTIRDVILFPTLRQEKN